jgi:hypothetical protein
MDESQGLSGAGMGNEKEKEDKDDECYPVNHR